MENDIQHTETRFHAAADHLAAAVTSNNSGSFNDPAKLALYGLYKQAMVGKCNTSKPGILNMSGRAKWNAWNNLGDLSQPEAMSQYVQIVSRLSPNWDGGKQDSTSHQQQQEQQQEQQQGPYKHKLEQPMGPVFSSLAVPLEQDDHTSSNPEANDTSLHEAASGDDFILLAELLQSGTDVNLLDADGCSALHYAADRGHQQMVKMLLSKGACVSLADSEGQTALHYAAFCSHEKAGGFCLSKNIPNGVTGLANHPEVCQLLLDAGADAALLDRNGDTAQKLAPAGWAVWHTHTANQVCTD